MSRSVVRGGTERCPECLLNERWCLCAGLVKVDPPLPIHVVMHRAEQNRPTSTGHLIGRVIPSARIHLFDPWIDRAKPPELPTDREQWVLHPAGKELPPCSLPSEGPAPALVLIDGTWAQSGPMLHAIQEGARRFKLPMVGESRYWLRRQTRPGHFSTAEALAFALAHLGLSKAAEVLRDQLELRVYAGLLSRGHNERASQYLASSTMKTRYATVVERLSSSRTSEPANRWRRSPQLTSSD